MWKSNYSFTMIIQKKSVPPWLHLHHYVEHTSLLKVMLAKHMQMPVGWPVTCGGALKLGKLFTFMLAKWKPSQRHHFPSLLNWVNGDAEIVHNCCRRAKRGDNSILWGKSPPSHYLIKRYYTDTRVQKKWQKYRNTKPHILGSKKVAKIPQ